MSALYNQLNRLKVEELALQSMINSRDEDLQYTQEAPDDEISTSYDKSRPVNTQDPKGMPRPEISQLLRTIGTQVLENLWTTQDPERTPRL
uniref:Uncharacterized protein n=1 Tax=Leptobrachium leishanense TaxID=445787 RepID=A0A8C5M247_9ANUR